MNPWLAQQLEELGLSTDEAPDSARAWTEFLSRVESALDSKGGLFWTAGVERLFDNAPDAIYLHDVRGNLLDFNEAACRALGYTREELLEMEVADFEMTIEPGAMWKEMSTDDTFTVGGKQLRKDGSTFPAEVRVTAFMSGGQKIISSVVRDISERKEREEELEQLNEELERARDAAVSANKAKSTFLANMSHELRTPLNAVIGYSEMLIEDMQATGAEEFVGDVERVLTAGRHLLSIINDVLDLSKIEAGKMQVNLDSFEIRPMLEAIGSTIQPMADKNDNVLYIDTADEPIEMVSDPTKLRQILFNLLSNACKFTSGGRVELRVERVERGGQSFVEFEVRDTGIGMTDEQLDHVFGAFNQADPSTTRDYGGTGLGLAISRHFCRLLGGDITALSEIDVGSIFRVTLPQNSSSVEVDAMPTVGAQTTPVEDLADDDRDVVLVVDDDEGMRELLRRTLEPEGVRVVEAANGREGLRLARELEPVAITLDVMMPSLDGWSLMALLRKNPALRDIPIILVTMVDERSRGLALGADHYLVKPVDRNQLVSIVGQYRRASKDAGPVLVVEDDDATRELMVRTLLRDGWRVEEATNGVEALECVEQTRPALVLLDLMMPRMDGFEFLSRFRQRPGMIDVPIVVVTAKELTERERAELEASVVDVVRKVGRERQEVLSVLRRLARLAVEGPAGAGEAKETISQTARDIAGSSTE